MLRDARLHALVDQLDDPRLPHRAIRVLVRLAAGADQLAVKAQQLGALGLAVVVQPVGDDQLPQPVVRIGDYAGEQGVEVAHCGCLGDAGVVALDPSSNLPSVRNRIGQAVRKVSYAVTLRTPKNAILPVPLWG